MRRTYLALFLGAALAIPAARPARAVVQGSATADVLADRRERAGEYAQGAIWRRTAIDLLEHLSMPMYAEIRLSAQLSGDPDEKQAVKDGYRSQVAEPMRQERAALERDLRQAARQGGTRPDAAVQAAADDFGLQWVVAYPDRYFRFGLYRQIKMDQEKLIAAGKASQAVDLEILARRSCARQYRAVIIDFLGKQESRLRERGQQETARGYALLSRHYAHLATEQLQDADWIRGHRQAVEEMLRGHSFPAGTAEAAFADRMDALRLSSLSRPFGVEQMLFGLDAKHPQAGLEIVRYFTRNHGAMGLLMSIDTPIPEVSRAAETALSLDVAKGNLTALNGLETSMEGLPRPGAVVRTNRLLSAYTGLTAPGSDRIGRDPAACTQVVQFWKEWWRRGLQPGLDVTYFRDAPCHVAQTTCSATTDAGTGVFPTGAKAGRWEAVLQVPQDRIEVLTASDDGSARVTLDGVPLAVTHDAIEHRLVSRLLLTPGNHTLQMEYVAGRLRSEPAFRLVPLAADPRPLGWLRHPRPISGKVAPAVAAALLAGNDESSALEATARPLGLAGLALLLLGTAALLWVRRSPAVLRVRARGV